MPSFKGSNEIISILSLVNPIFWFWVIKSFIATSFPTSDTIFISISSYQNSIGNPGIGTQNAICHTILVLGTKSTNYDSITRSWPVMNHGPPLRITLDSSSDWNLIRWWSSNRKKASRSDLSYPKSWTPSQSTLIEPDSQDFGQGWTDSPTASTTPSSTRESWWTFEALLSFPAISYVPSTMIILMTLEQS